MNERIRELAEQAKFIAEEGINRQISYNAELKAFAEKFAELIVNDAVECVRDVLREEDSALSYEGAAQIQKMIKQHFGI